MNSATQERNERKNDDSDFWRQSYDALYSQMQRLAKYASHHHKCAIASWEARGINDVRPRPKCTCGLASVLSLPTGEAE